MIQILPCPGCSRQTELPECASRRATIQCPHCSQQFVVSEVLEREFGAWLIIEDPLSPAVEVTGQAPSDQAPNDIVTEDSSDSDVYELAEVSHETGTGAAASIPPPQSIAQPDANKPKLGHVPRERSRRKTKKSPLGSVIQIFLGGVAAIPISLLLIWHLIGADVADMGPTVGRYIPWLVPEKFRPYDGARETASRRSRTPAASPRRTSGFRNFDDVLPPREEAPDPTDVDPRLSALDPDSSDPLSQLPPIDPGDSASANASDSVDGSEDIFTTIRKTIDALDGWASAYDSGAPDLKALARTAYDDFLELAAALEAIPADNPVFRTARDQLKPIAKVVAERADVQNMLVQGSRFWIGEQKEAESFSLATLVDVHSVEIEEELQQRGEVWSIAPSPTLPFQLEISRQLGDLPSIVDSNDNTQLLILGTVNKSDSSAPSAAVFTAHYLYAF